MQTSTLFGRRIETGILSLLEHDKPSSLILSDTRVDTTVGYLQRQLQDAIKDIDDENWISCESSDPDSLSCASTDNDRIVFVFFLQSNKDHAVDSDLFSSKP